MAGRQMAFFMTEEEEKDFLCQLMEGSDAQIYYERKLAEEVTQNELKCQELKSFPLSQFSFFQSRGSSVTYWLWNPRFLGALKDARAAGNEVLFVGDRFQWAWAGAVEFTASMPKDMVLSMGRIAAMDRYYDRSGNFYDRPETRRWYERVKRQFLKRFVKMPCWGFMVGRTGRTLYRDIHVSPGAVAWERSGGVLKQSHDDSPVRFTCQEE